MRPRDGADYFIVVAPIGNQLDGSRAAPHLTAVEKRWLRRTAAWGSDHGARAWLSILVSHNTVPVGIGTAFLEATQIHAGGDGHDQGFVGSRWGAFALVENPNQESPRLRREELYGHAQRRAHGR